MNPELEEEIKETYKKLSDKFENGQGYELNRLFFNIGCTPRRYLDLDAEYIEYNDEGTQFALVSGERGEITSYKKADSIDELMYIMFKDGAISHGFAYEVKNRDKEKDPLDLLDARYVAFPKAVEKMRNISDEWAERLEGELDEIMRRSPPYGESRRKED